MQFPGAGTSAPDATTFRIDPMDPSRRFSALPKLDAVVVIGGLSLLAWTYAGYPAVITALARRRQRVERPGWEPTVTVLIPAYNEAEFIAKKVRNSRQLDYPADRLQILVVDDGSDDGTAELARSEGAQVVSVSPRRGKSNGINVGMGHATGELVVLTDANGSLDPGSIRGLVAEFADDRVAVVSGAKVPEGTGAHGGGEEAYWRYENMLKSAEGRLGCTVGADGGVYAVRRRTFAPLPSGTLGDDFIVPLAALSHGWRVAHTDKARAREQTSLSVRDEFERRTRISAGIWQGLVEHRRLLHPSRGLVSLALGTHRGLRTVVIPVSLPVVTVATASLARRSGLARVVLTGELLGWTGAVAGAVGDARVFALPYQFAMTNAAALRGGLRFFSRRQATTWKRTSRGQWT
jgi:poly-beta-1,6-N-acetyl-D-glucosamine synthase